MSQAPLPFVPGSELAGEVAALRDGVTAFAVGDRLICSGFTGGSIPALPFNLAPLKGASLVGVDAARFGMVHEPARSLANNQTLMDWLIAGRLKYAPGQVYPFPRFADAFAAVAGRTAVGRVVVEVG